MPVSLKTLLVRLYKEPTFRREFAQNPTRVMRDLGFDVAGLSLPKKIDIAQLEKQMLKEQAGTAAGGPALTLSEIASLSDQQVWERYGDKIQGPGKPVDQASPPLFLAASPEVAHLVAHVPIAVYAVTIATIAQIGGKIPPEPQTKPKPKTRRGPKAKP